MYQQKLIEQELKFEEERKRFATETEKLHRMIQAQLNNFSAYFMLWFQDGPTAPL